MSCSVHVFHGLAEANVKVEGATPVIWARKGDNTNPNNMLELCIYPDTIRICLGVGRVTHVRGTAGTAERERER